MSCVWPAPNVWRPSSAPEVQPQMASLGVSNNFQPQAPSKRGCPLRVPVLQGLLKWKTTRKPFPFWGRTPGFRGHVNRASTQNRLGAGKAGSWYREMPERKRFLAARLGTCSASWALILLEAFLATSNGGPHPNGGPNAEARRESQIVQIQHLTKIRA